MGIRDESWCSDCGKSQPFSYTEVICGDCTSNAYETRANIVINYLNLHLIGLEQDSEDIHQKMDYVIDMNSDEYKDLEVMDISVNGQIIATAHFLKVAKEMEQNAS